VLLYGNAAGTLTMMGLVQSSPTALPPSGDSGTMVIVDGSLWASFTPCAQEALEKPKKIANENNIIFISQLLVKFVIQLFIWLENIKRTPGKVSFTY
jgi:hypothetical protein